MNAAPALSRVVRSALLRPRSARSLAASTAERSSEWIDPPFDPVVARARLEAELRRKARELPHLAGLIAGLIGPDQRSRT